MCPDPLLMTLIPSNNKRIIFTTWRFIIVYVMCFLLEGIKVIIVHVMCFSLESIKVIHM